MNLLTEAYLVQTARWPNSGRHILAQFDDESVIVYQAYRPAIGHFAARNGCFGGEFSLNRMSWIKPNFLWMMYRCGLASKEGQEVVLADLAPRMRSTPFRWNIHATCDVCAPCRSAIFRSSAWVLAVARGCIATRTVVEFLEGHADVERVFFFAFNPAAKRRIPRGARRTAW